MPLVPDVASITVATAGTEQQVVTSTRMVRKVTFRARASNAGKMYVGDSGVTSGNGYELNAGETKDVELPNDEPFDLSKFWVDAGTNGDKIDAFFMVEG
jgi:hypothetical protein